MPRSLKPHLFRKEGWGLLFYRGHDFINGKEKDTDALGSNAVIPHFMKIRSFWLCRSY